MEHTEENIYKILLEMQAKLGEMSSDIKNNLAQAVKTNGRVTHLEEDVTELKEFRDTWKGKIAVIGVCLGFLGSIIASWLKKELGL